MAIKYVRAAVGAVNAGQSKGRTEISTFDDARTRKLTGLWTSDQTVLIHTKLDEAGTVFADIEDIVFSKMLEFLELDHSFGSDVKFSFDVQNDTAANLVAGQAIVLRYEV